MASRQRNIRPFRWWGGAERSLCCRAGALGLPQRIWGVMRLSVIPHSGSSTWDLFSCWMGRQAAQEDSHFRPASVAVNASRQRRADTRPRVSSLNTPVWTPSPPLSVPPPDTHAHTCTHMEHGQDTENNDFRSCISFKNLIIKFELSRTF